jgi:hypothetical protein
MSAAHGPKVVTISAPLRAEERATEYRDLAKEIFVEANTEPDPELREHLTEAAHACLKAAKRLEAQRGRL